MPVVGGLSEDSVQVLQPGIDAEHHLPPLRCLVRARVHGGMEALTDLLYTGLQFLALQTGVRVRNMALVRARDLCGRVEGGGRGSQINFYTQVEIYIRG